MSTLFLNMKSLYLQFSPKIFTNSLYSSNDEHLHIVTHGDMLCSENGVVNFTNNPKINKFQYYFA